MDMLKLKHKAIAQLALFLVPTVLYAQPVSDVSGFFRLIRNTLNSVIPVLIGLAVVIFLFGVIKYIQAGDKEESRSEGRQFMIYSIVAIFVMVSVWGLVKVLTVTLNLNNSGITVPQF